MVSEEEWQLPLQGGDWITPVNLPAYNANDMDAVSKVQRQGGCRCTASPVTAEALGK